MILRSNRAAQIITRFLLRVHFTVRIHFPILMSPQPSRSQRSNRTETATRRRRILHCESPRQMNQIAGPDKRNESSNVAIHHRGWNARQNNLQIPQSFIDRCHLIRSPGIVPKLRDTLSLCCCDSRSPQGRSSFTPVNKISRQHHAATTLIRRSMSRSELNKWGETRILPSRIATTTCSFCNL